jgi:myxalamid-type polyketide synthase MxaB
MGQDAINQRLSVSSGSALPPEFENSTTLPQLLCQAAEGTHGICHLLAHSLETTQTYAALLHEATCVLQGLRQLGLEPQACVILHFLTSRDFLTAFWACVLGGFVPVPIAPAIDYSTDNHKTNVLRSAMQSLAEPVVLTSQALQATVQEFCQAQQPVLPDHQTALPNRVVALEALSVNPPAANFYAAQPDELALLLFTSGSTGDPKGVMLSHRNLLTSIYGMATVNQFAEDAISLNWMPLEHVASLVMFHLTQVSVGCQQMQVANELILTDPLKWLDLIDHHRVTHTWAPNFAYGLVSERLTKTNRNWDLACLRWMGNGAEAVVGKTTRRFLQLLAPYGLGETVVSPGYGMSETCSGIVHSHQFSLATTSDADAFVEVGLPIPGVSLRIVDEQHQLVTEGTIGRLQVRGATVMQGYYNRPDLNQQVFTDGWFDTGDLGFLNAGRLTITGRQKDVMIVNGVNYYNHEIEAAVEALSGITVSFTAACAVRRLEDSTDQLAIFFTPDPVVASTVDAQIDLIKTIRRQVTQTIGIVPSYVIPVAQRDIPKTNLGKIQRSQLAQRFAAGEFDALLQQLEASHTVPIEHLPQSQREQEIAQIWQAVLHLPTVSIYDNFFELGGTSLLLMQVLHQLQARFGQSLSAVTLFQYPTIAALASHLGQNKPTELRALRRDIHPTNGNNINRNNINRNNTDIAVIGMACRFPGANTIEEFWQNLCNGVESISFFTDAEILASGVDPHLVQHPDYVKASPILDVDVAEFDADFFGYSPKEACLLDPQQRLLLECAWASLEDAGYDPLTYPTTHGGAIGLYAGASTNTYLLNSVYPNRHQLDPNDSLNVFTLSSMGGFQLTTANDKDYLTTRVSYKLNLTGPSVNVQTACSTSLVAIHMARQSLINGECDMALAGGVSVHTPQKVGHLYQDGMILSPDGHCRAFDAKAAGTIFGSGAGVVVLKRLEQAITDGDQIYAVIKGSAIGNDGGQKVGYFAPQAEGQARVTAEAFAISGIDPASVGYVEAHGTGTALGDPIEIAGLTQAFRLSTQQRQFCAIGSVKTNVGHLNTASGVVGLIKTVLCLHHKQIPPSLHFETPNPQIDFANSPFYVNTKRTAWLTDAPRRASVNSLGIGGTNVHVVLEEAPQPLSVSETSALPQLLTLSAKSEPALQALIQRYYSYLINANVCLTDLCFTTHVGRSHFNHRLAIIATSLSELRQKLKQQIDGQRAEGVFQAQIQNITSQPIAFLFTGQGSQYPGMGQALYKTCPIFQTVVDRCDQIVQQELGQSILSVMWESDSLHQTIYTQPALFTIEYALAQLWIEWGVIPSAVMGHSIGEYVAACIAGVFSLEDALKLVITRGKLMQKLPPGMMVSVMAGKDQINELIAGFENDISIAAINGERNVVLSGTPALMEQTVAKLTASGIKTKTLSVSHAFHSPMMEPILTEFEQVARQIRYTAPQIHLVANLTGTTATAAIATPSYWCQHIRQPVQFAESVKTLYNVGYRVFLECGTKPILMSMMQANIKEPGSVYLPSLHSVQSDWNDLLYSLAHLYIQGISIHWNAFHHAKPRRISLPTYAFQRQRHWIETFPLSVIHSVHPLLGQRIPTPRAVVFQSRLSTIMPPFLQDHCVNQATVFPASAFVEMMLAAGQLILKSSALSLADITIQQKLLLSENTEKTIQVIFDQTVQSVQIYSLDKSDGIDTTDWQLHCSGTVAANHPAAQAVDIQQLCQTLPERRSAAEHYRQCQDQGLTYGDSFQAVRQIWRRDGEALGQLELPQSIVDRASAYCCHPVLLDAAFQTTASALPATHRSHLYLPTHIHQLHWVNNDSVSSNVFWSHVKLDHWQPDAKFLSATVCLYNQAGELVVRIERLTLQQMPPTASPNLEPWRHWLYTIDWQPQPSRFSRPLTDAETWLIFADCSGIAVELAKQLRSHHQNCYLIYSVDVDCKDQDLHIHPASLADFEQRLREIEQLSHPSAIRGVVYLWSLDCDTDAAATSTLNPGALHLIQALAKLNWSPQCWFVTQGAQTVGNRATSHPIQACLWGMGKVIALEHPEFSMVQIDLDPEHLNAAAIQLLEEICTDGTEVQIAFCQNKRYVARLIQQPFTSVVPDSSQSLRLNISERGSLENLCWQSIQRQMPRRNEIEIRVQATGLNFRDVLNALDLYPGEAGLLGLECAGEVVAVGADVKEFCVGDAVVAIAEGSFSQFVTTPAALAAPKPTPFSFTAAATIPTAFLTATYALRELAHLKAGDRVLIHAAAGGVGQAAVQMAQQIGVEVFATASFSKQAFLRSQGIQHVFNSRSLEFADEILSATGGKGVDLVLNSLAGEFIPKSLQVLRPGGCFVEIGKTEVWTSAQVAAMRPDVSYFLVDLVELTQQQPARIQAMLRDLMLQFQSGQLQPLPQTCFPATQVIAAFRFMQRAKQMGKIVVSQGHLTGSQVRPDGAYLITGGHGGLGLEVARWLIEQGATHLILVGRTAPRRTAQTAIQAWQQQVTVEVVQADVADRDQLAALLASPSCNSLRGIIHAAGLLDDGILLQQTWERFAAMMAPKVQGAWNLHKLTQHRPLDFLVLFSSAASVIGSAGQANYAAANAFLDALAHYRHSLGLPALSINWGPWNRVGMAARMEVNLRAGITPIEPELGLEILAFLLQHSAAQVGVLPIDRATWQVPASAFFAEFHAGSTPRTAQASHERPLPQLDPQSLAAYIQTQVGNILGVDGATLDPNQGLSELGIDSLTSVELRNALQKHFACRLPSTLLFDYPTIASLTQYLQQTLCPQTLYPQPSAPSISIRPAPSAQPDLIQQLSEAEAEALLLQELERFNDPLR